MSVTQGSSHHFFIVYSQSGGVTEKQCYGVLLLINHVVQALRSPMGKHFLEFPAGETLQEARRRILPEFSHRAAQSLYKRAYRKIYKYFYFSVKQNDNSAPYISSENNHFCPANNILFSAKCRLSSQQKINLGGAYERC
jgi:hypothetical protein